MPDCFNLARPATLSEITALGGLMVIGIGLNLLNLTRISLTNMLPALPVAAVLASIFLEACNPDCRSYRNHAGRDRIQRERCVERSETRLCPSVERFALENICRPDPMFRHAGFTPEAGAVRRK